MNAHLPTTLQHTYTHNIQLSRVLVATLHLTLPRCLLNISLVTWLAGRVSRMRWEGVSEARQIGT